MFPLVSILQSLTFHWNNDTYAHMHSWSGQILMPNLLQLQIWWQYYDGVFFFGNGKEGPNYESTYNCCLGPLGFLFKCFVYA